MERHQIAERIASRTIEGQTFLVIIDQGRLHTLSEVGTFLWERMEDATTEELVGAVVENFDVEEARARKDVLLFLKQLHEAGALQEKG